MWIGGEVLRERTSCARRKTTAEKIAKTACAVALLTYKRRIRREARGFGVSCRNMKQQEHKSAQKGTGRKEGKQQHNAKKNKAAKAVETATSAA